MRSVFQYKNHRQLATFSEQVEPLSRSEQQLDYCTVRSATATQSPKEIYYRLTTMLLCVQKRIVILITLNIHVRAFWWSQTTTTQAPTVLKHIPLTYFRTYTYQPMPGGNFPFSFLGPMQPMTYAGHMQQPLLTHGAYPGNSVVAPISSIYPYDPLRGTRMITTTPATPTTRSTTTTTSTTPAPTTTTTTTTTSAPSTTTTTTATPMPELIQPLIDAAAYGGQSNIYSNYNRRFYNQPVPNYMRPQYPYPDYNTYNTASAALKGSSRLSQIQFVPCMCPINMELGANVQSLNEHNPTSFYAQSRNADDDEDNDGIDTDLSLSMQDDELPKHSKVIIEPDINVDVGITTDMDQKLHISDERNSRHIPTSGRSLLHGTQQTMGIHENI